MFLREALFHATAEIHLEATERYRKLGHELAELRCRGLADEPYHPEKEAYLETGLQLEYARWRVIDWILKRLDFVGRVPRASLLPEQRPTPTAEDMAALQIEG